MNVNDFDKYISSYLDGDLRESDIKEFDELLKNDANCRKKFKDYKKMLNMLSSIEVKASSDFADKVYQKVKEQETIIPPTPPKTIFGYNYAALSGIAAAVGIFAFSIVALVNSESVPSFNMNQLSAKKVEEKINANSSMNLIAEDDTSNEDEDIELPKIHLVGGKK
tara:strand:+ start:1517 stop:2014 length:498 start_codon:yes stop_codon:yes gene_type:complete